MLFVFLPETCVFIVFDLKEINGTITHMTIPLLYPLNLVKSPRHLSTMKHGEDLSRLNNELINIFSTPCDPPCTR